MPFYSFRSVDLACVVITLKTSVKTKWREFEFTTKYVTFLTKHAHTLAGPTTWTKKVQFFWSTNEYTVVLRTAIYPYSIRIFQVYVTVLHAMNTLEFFCLGVKITYSRINVYTRISHILWIQSKFCFQENAMHPTFFHKILLTKGSPSYSRSTTDVWYTLTKIHERLWTDVFHHIRYEYSRCTSRIVCALNTLGFYSVTITYPSLEYSRIFWLSRSVKKLFWATKWLKNLMKKE